MQLGDLYRVNQIQIASYNENLHENISMFEEIINAEGSICLVLEVNCEIEGYTLSYPTDENRRDFHIGYVKTIGEKNSIYLHDLCISKSQRGTWQTHLD